ncbi:uncharacterized protein LOC109847719 [Asparagus officinalis]|uniref:uncharacterized protein LOC109847719 n=1 Tax=Asparagus officinalis TaxID=4686 RepID=UPI00098E4F78|nr:uncharacterized protein LOC109847719 [Asparagus officinalis]
MEWWIRVVSPIRRVWIRVAARIRMRKSGLGPLRNEVSTCEYEDVQVMWEMLRKATDVEIGRAVRPRERRVDTWSVFEWAGRGRRRKWKLKKKHQLKQRPEVYEDNKDSFAKFTENFTASIESN